MKHVKIIALVALLSLLTVVAFAQESDTKAEETKAKEKSDSQEARGLSRIIGRWDKDGDNKLSKEEWGESRAGLKFEEADTDKDGFVTGIEFRDSRRLINQKRTEERFTKRDANKDGKLSAEEFGQNERMFKRLDANEDGVITKEEFGRSRGSRFGDGLNRRGARGPGVSLLEKEKAPASRGSLSPTDQFKKLDQDADGKLSMSEYNRSDSIFKRLDANKDGLLTQREFSKGQRRRGGPASFVESDKNKDGAITPDEFFGGEVRFKQADKDSSGSLSKSEYNQIFFGRQYARRLLRQLDENKDKRISPKELANDEKFKTYDTDKDGSLSEKELRAVSSDDMGELTGRGKKEPEAQKKEGSEKDEKPAVIEEKEEGSEKK